MSSGEWRFGSREWGVWCGEWGVGVGSESGSGECEWRVKCGEWGVESGEWKWEWKGREGGRVRPGVCFG